MKKAIFLDRDGTLNKELNYLYKPSEFEFIPGTVDAIKIFHELDYLVIVLTNQAGIARGYYTEEDVHKLHRYIDGLLAAEGTFIDAYYYCPHHPDGVVEGYIKECECRKPKIGLIDKAIRDFDIDLSDSIIVGDNEKDMKAGRNAGIGTKGQGECILVRSGHSINEKNTVADAVCDTIYEFAQKLKLKHQK